MFGHLTLNCSFLIDTCTRFFPCSLLTVGLFNLPPWDIPSLSIQISVPLCNCETVFLYIIGPCFSYNFYCFIFENNRKSQIKLSSFYIFYLTVSCSSSIPSHLGGSQFYTLPYQFDFLQPKF